jgi:hypothetical protein
LKRASWFPGFLIHFRFGCGLRPHCVPLQVQTIPPCNVFTGLCSRLYGFGRHWGMEKHGGKREIRSTRGNTKSELRSTKQIRIPKSQIRNPCSGFRASDFPQDFALRACFELCSKSRLSRLRRDKPLPRGGRGLFAFAPVPSLVEGKQPRSSARYRGCPPPPGYRAASLRRTNRSHAGNDCATFPAATRRASSTPGRSRSSRCGP